MKPTCGQLHFHSEPSLDYLIERIWENLRLVKVYTKKRGERPDLTDPVCLRRGATIEVCFPKSVSQSSIKEHCTRMFVLVFISHLQRTFDLRLFGELSTPVCHCNTHAVIDKRVMRL